MRRRATLMAIISMFGISHAIAGGVSNDAENRPQIHWTIANPPDVVVVSHSSVSANSRKSIAVDPVTGEEARLKAVTAFSAAPWAPLLVYWCADQGELVLQLPGDDHSEQLHAQKGFWRDRLSGTIHAGILPVRAEVVRMEFEYALSGMGPMKVPSGGRVELALYGRALAGNDAEEVARAPIDNNGLPRGFIPLVQSAAEDIEEIGFLIHHSQSFSLVPRWRDGEADFLTLYALQDLSAQGAWPVGRIMSYAVFPADDSTVVRLLVSRRPGIQAYELTIAAGFEKVSLEPLQTSDVLGVNALHAFISPYGVIEVRNEPTPSVLLFSDNGKEIANTPLTSPATRGAINYSGRFLAVLDEAGVLTSYQVSDDTLAELSRVQVDLSTGNRHPADRE